MTFLFSVVLFITVPVVAWLGLGFLGYGIKVGWANKSWVKLLDHSDIVIDILSGPCGLLASLTVFGWHKPEFRYHTQEERWELFQKEYNLDRQYFEVHE